MKRLTKIWVEYKILREKLHVELHKFDENPIARRPARRWEQTWKGKFKSIQI